MRISVYGTGYLGAVHAAGMAALGHEVLGMDTDAGKIAALERGEAPFFEPGLPELLTRTVRSGALRFTRSLEEAADFGDVHFVCVGTPQLSGGRGADLSAVEGVVGALDDALPGSAQIVGKSTVPVGTARRLADLVAARRTGRPELRMSWNPEFLREGFAVQDTLRPDRLVFGVEDERGEQVLREVYAAALRDGTPSYTTDLETAELVKVAANSFLAMKISFINAMAEVCERVDADVTVLADAIGQDARIGRRFLNAGVGFGGGCLGKDIRAFHTRSTELGATGVLGFLENADTVNTRRRERVVELADEALGGLPGRRVTVLGAAFKPNSDDVRDSPALAVARSLHEQGARVVVHDPEALANARRVAPELEYADELEGAVAGADLVVHLTEWSEYAAADPAELGALSAGRLLIDGRNALDRDAWSAAGWTCHALGRPVVTPWARVADATRTLPTRQLKEEVA